MAQTKNLEPLVCLNNHFPYFLCDVHCIYCLSQEPLRFFVEICHIPSCDLAVTTGRTFRLLTSCLGASYAILVVVCSQSETFRAMPNVIMSTMNLSFAQPAQTAGVLLVLTKVSHACG